MILAIPDVLTGDTLIQARLLLETADWQDGRLTAGHQAQRVKNNRQIPDQHPAGQQVGQCILQALSQNPVFLSAALPLHILPPRFNRYSGGEHYGTHTDAAIFSTPEGQRIRSDLSCTLFFSNPDEYDGGELVIDDTYGSQRIKLPAGHLILYPSTSLHHVTPVTRGSRLCAFFWVQSLVRDDAQRSLLLNLDIATQEMLRDHPEHPSGTRLTGVYHNLLRRWSNT